MPSETPLLQTEVEKPQHFTYLKEFRTQQCPLFLQHKCTLHRPFTCFHWHFLNQRRRRPVRRRDGTFNYSPDIYCTKYDETTGICPNGNDCPYLHRTAGDTERRYHLRYYKTGTCVYETDPRGHCAKNGPHCAFAHGAGDLRPPVYDIHELKNVDQIDLESITISTSPSSLEKDQILAEDPKWNDTNYVLHYYKTDPCKRPPRLCRQGYACPQYHNTRDRRRSPKNNKYRSTPCPNVKHGDEWGDPSSCESGDNCSYCHTRTEQQFHTEIYKSTKCNDMVQSGYCPRGPFCAFAHVEQEMTLDRDVTPSSDTSLAAFLTNALPNTGNGTDNSESKLNAKKDQNGKHVISSNRLPDPIGKERTSSISSSLGNGSNFIGLNNFSGCPLPDPIGKGRSGSLSSSISSDVGMPWMQYLKAPGSERDDFQGTLKKQLQAIENDPSIDSNEKNKRTQNLILLHNLNSNTVSSAFNTTSSVSCSPTGIVASSSMMSALAPAFYPPGDTVESVLGKALDDISLDDFDINSLDKEFDNDNNSVSSSISCGLSASGCLGSVSGPIGIPPNKIQQRDSVGSLSQSPPSPFGSYIHSMLPIQHHPVTKEEQLSSPFLGHPSSSKYPNSYTEMNSMSPRNTGPLSPLTYGFNNNNHNFELVRMKECKTKMSDIENVFRNTFDVLKKSAEDSHSKAKLADEEKLHAVKQRDEAVSQTQRLKQEIDRIKTTGPYVRCLVKTNEVETISITQLRQIRQQLMLDLDRIDKIICQHTSLKCLICQDKTRTVSLLPCNHRVICDVCAPRTRECPICLGKVKVPVQFNC